MVFILINQRYISYTVSTDSFNTDQLRDGNNPGFYRVATLRRYA